MTSYVDPRLLRMEYEERVEKGITSYTRKQLQQACLQARTASRAEQPTPALLKVLQSAVRAVATILM